MEFKLAPVELKPDLRSSIFTRLRRGAALGWFRVAILLLLDTLSISIAWQLAVSYGTELQSPWTDEQGLRFLPLVLAVEISIIATRSLYKAGSLRRDYLGLLKVTSLSSLLLLLIAFLYEPSSYVSRSAFLLFWLFNTLLVCLGRFSFDLATDWIRRQGAIRYPVFLISDGEDKARNVELIEREHHYNLLGIADPSSLDRVKREETFQVLRKLRIAEAFVSWSAIKNRLHLCWHFQAAGITLRILQEQDEAFPTNSEFWMMGRVPCINVPTPVIVGGQYSIKRCFDFCGAVILLLLFSPLYFLLAILIKLDSPGEVFFRQTRVGLHNRNFKVWKFRTMVANAAQLQANLELKNEMKDGVLFKMKDDPRVTRLGKFLRRYSLDELPQLFNVLVGEMSFVGPRPLPVRDVEKFKEKYFIRQEVLPGITGLWQVSGRSNIDNFEDAVDLDLNYITNWSLGMDLNILLKTVKVVFCKTGAY
ncbi:MAG: sugar transferase [Oscillatoriophycideae cyanobacterium NC_groundwater_1537_Pr4_S-0.65um_50_18]|nr:sugar transferase [Oscillatoriophycideae cyanobacterium NC_groundwater_1537_Pr4_S-0.65um_50_18]